MSKTNKVPKLIHSTFARATINPEPPHVAISANAEQHTIRMIVWPAQIDALMAVLEQARDGITPSQPLSVVWEPVIKES